MMTVYLLLVVALTLATGLHGEVDFCSLCDPPGSHTACIYPKVGPGGNCTGYTPSPLTAKEKEQLLDIHNRLRSKVARGQGWVVNSTYDAQPKAADMRQLYWDDELELVAQRWVDQCLAFYTTTPHDSCRDSKRFPVGQNIVTSAYSQPMPSDVDARTLDWYNEIKDFNPRWVGKFIQNPNPDPSKQTGHYTQLVWGWTHLLGCGRAVFEEEFEGSKWSVERIVCNYAPGGNFYNFPVYKVGEPCSKCPPGTQCSTKYTGLCALKNDEREFDDTNEADEGIVIQQRLQVEPTTVPPVTWQYWTPGKFWVVPDHLSESPEEEQLNYSPVPLLKEQSPSPSPVDNLITASSPSPFEGTSPSLPPQSDKHLSSSPRPQFGEDTFLQRPNLPRLPELLPPELQLRNLIFKFTSTPLFNNSKYTSVSWIEIPNLPPRSLLDILSSSPSLSTYRMLPSPSVQDSFSASIPNPMTGASLQSPVPLSLSSSSLQESSVLLPTPVQTPSDPQSALSDDPTSTTQPSSQSPM